MVTGDPQCTRCKQHRGLDEVCEMGFGPESPQFMVVTGRPNSENFLALLTGYLKDAGLEPSLFYFTSIIKCRNFDLNIGKGDIKACKPFLEQEIEEVKPEWILAFGNEALSALTGHSGIMKHRGRVYETPHGKVMATISPAAVARNPGQTASFMADLRRFAAEVYQKSAKVKPPNIHYILTKAHYEKLKKILARADLISFDLETTSEGEYAAGATIVSIAGTVLVDGKIMVWAMPLGHPQSPFRGSWRVAVTQLSRLICPIPKRVAQNGKFDCRWMRHVSGVLDLDITFDTMLASHLLDENREKGLKPQATSRLGVAPWGIDTKDLMNTPIMQVLEYNALDTYYAYHVYRVLRKELQAQPRLLRIFTRITMPLANRLIAAEQRGAWIDREKLATNGHVAREMLKDIDRQIRDFVPDLDDDEKAEAEWPQMGKKKRFAEVNFNASNFARWFLFNWLELPVLERGKEKEDGSEGDPSMAEGVLMALRGQSPAVELMLQRVEWNKMVSAFFNAYDELLDDNDRIHTTFKVSGTVTGRMSSGKADDEKITGRKPSRGINLQQVPRNPLVRSLFGAPEPYAFVEADFSQIELRIAAFLSRDRTMLRLYQAGEDIHAATASWVLGIPRSQVTKDDRKKAKAVNFGFVYGMGWRKFVVTAFEKYGVVFSEAEAQAIRRAFFEQFKGLQGWHQRQRRIVRENRRVQNPIGRVRHLPDIDSPMQGVAAEAERQAINSPVQGFGSDLCTLSLVLIDDKIKKLGIDGHIFGNVHDALLFEIHEKDLAEALPIIKHTMENLPLQRLFGVTLDVPIISDIKVGTNWGEARELSEDEVYNWTGSAR